MLLKEPFRGFCVNHLESHCENNFILKISRQPKCHKCSYEWLWGLKMWKYNSDIHCKGCRLCLVPFAVETETMCDELATAPVPVPLQPWGQEAGKSWVKLAKECWEEGDSRFIFCFSLSFCGLPSNKLS